MLTAGSSLRINKSFIVITLNDEQALKVFVVNVNQPLAKVLTREVLNGWFRIRKSIRKTRRDYKQDGRGYERERL